MRFAGRAALVFAHVVAIGCAGRAPERPCPPLAVPRTPAELAPDAAATPLEGAGGDEDPAVDVQAGTCDAAWIPGGLVLAPSSADAAMIEAVRLWLGTPGGAAVVANPGGVAWVEAEDDELEEDPRRLGHHGRLVCTPEASWLLAALREQATNRPVTCGANACCWEGVAEGDPAGTLVFRAATPDEGEGVWFLRLVATLGEANIEADDRAATRRWAADRITRIARESCPAPRRP